MFRILRNENLHFGFFVSLYFPRYIQIDSNQTDAKHSWPVCIFLNVDLIFSKKKIIISTFSILYSTMNGSNSHNSLSYDSDDMINDHSSMEDYVYHLTDKLKKLQDQVQYLKEGQIQNEEKYSTMKKENSTLHTKINFLEEQIRDIELQSEDKRKEAEQRFRDSMARIEREKSQELENCFTKICSLQKESFEAKEEIKRNQQTIERLQIAKESLENELRDRNDEIRSLKSEIKRLNEIIRNKNAEQCALDSTLIEAINHELLRNQAMISEEFETTNENHQSNHRQTDELIHSMKSELEQRLQLLKEENRSLKEANEELTAQLLNNHLLEGKSLLREGEAISSLANEISDLNSEQLKTALKEQQDVNAKLRAYIDGILLNIVENYPQLLEVKSNGQM
ncbi:Rab11 family-interacting protein 3 [Sarcoptes scabiei]|uniref:Rab11 family-interacting protein 3 n=3 Tax=Sarcoptes scabiei TaxID=52283 RepID=A0A834R920_SARSC|nr:Rab11 family-interacting protein 3 [Sarcoptes scabiei]